MVHKTCEDSQKELDDIAIKPIKGTMKLHAVVPLENTETSVRETSCYCDNCFKDGKFIAICLGWFIPVLLSVAVTEEIAVANGIAEEKKHELQQQTKPVPRKTAQRKTKNLNHTCML